MKVGILTTHPIQYYAPWFRNLSQKTDFETVVYYLHDTRNKGVQDKQFGRKVEWDTDLFSDYQYRFVPNRANSPSVQEFSGLWNPGLYDNLREDGIEVLLYLGYSFKTMLFSLFDPKFRRFEKIIKGDSHSLWPTNGLKSEINHFVKKCVLSRFDRYLYVGHANLQYWLEHGCERSDLFYSPHAVPIQSETKQRDRGDGPTTFAFVGKLTEKKNVLNILEAFESCPKNARLLIVGDGELRNKVEEVANRDSRIEFLGFVNQTELPTIYSRTDYIFLPSVGRSETWGLALNEAMQTGATPIASRWVGASWDLIRDGSTGLICDTGNVSAIKSAMNAAITNSASILPDTTNLGTYDKATDGLRRALESLR